jgi:hypothetical protein
MPRPARWTDPRTCPGRLIWMTYSALTGCPGPCARSARRHRVLEGRTSEAVGIGPLLGDQVAMPAQDCARRDQAMLAQHLRQPSDECGEDRSICPVQAGFRVGCAQHGDFVAQHQELDVLGRRRAGEQQQQDHQPIEDQIEQTQGHGSRSCPGGGAYRIRSSEAQADFWNLAGKHRRVIPRRRRDAVTVSSAALAAGGWSASYSSAPTLCELGPRNFVTQCSRR